MILSQDINRALVQLDKVKEDYLKQNEKNKHNYKVNFDIENIDNGCIIRYNFKIKHIQNSMFDINVKCVQLDSESALDDYRREEIYKDIDYIYVDNHVNIGYFKEVILPFMKFRENKIIYFG